MRHKPCRQAILAAIGSQAPLNRGCGAIQDNLLARNWGQRTTLDILLLRTGCVGLRLANRTGQDSLGRASRGVSKGTTVHRCQTTAGNRSAVQRGWSITRGPRIKATIVAWVLHQRATAFNQHDYPGVQLSRGLHTMGKSRLRGSMLNPLRREMRS